MKEECRRALQGSGRKGEKSPSTTTVRQMMLQWGVTPIWSRRAESTDELIRFLIFNRKKFSSYHDQRNDSNIRIPIPIASYLYNP